MVNYKKIKPALIIVVVIVFLFCGISNSFAVSKTENAKQMAVAKMYFRSLYWCVGGKVSEYTYNVGEFDFGDMKNGDWFHSATTTHAGAFVEGNTEKTDDGGGTGKGVDDQFYCGNNNTLVHSSIDALNKASGKNLTIADLACGPNNSDGVFNYRKKITTQSGKTLETCRDVINNTEDTTAIVNNILGQAQNHHFHLQDNRQQNLKKIFQDSLGSDPSKFSDEEMYYVLRLDFEQHCTTTNSKNTAAANGKVYKILDADGNLKDYPASTTAFGNVRTNTENKVGLFQSMTENDFAYQDNNGNMQKGQIGTCSDIEKILSDKDNKYVKAWLAAAKEDEDNGEHVADSPEDTAPDIDNLVTDNDDKCKGTSGLGWLLCPIIDMVGKATTSLYENMIEPYLKIESKLLGDTNQGGRSAWEIFRTFANIFLIILLLVVIFSQLTGVGIDNYGIKKSLPKLIAAAVLINLSYIICQLAVDLSNLLGYSLKTMFDQFATQVGVPTAHQTSAAGLTGGIGVGVVAGSVGIITAVGAWPAVGGALVAALPTVLGALVAAIFAIFFFFVLLGARQAGVIILVALSPLAFACYILPNTKNIFDTWKKAFRGLLLLYPLAGLLIGGGNFASVVILNASGDSGGFWVNIIALLIGVVPFFYLPKAMKDSFSALGNLGNKISGFGKNMGNRARNATQERVKNSNLRNAAADKLAEKNFDKNKLLKRQRDKLDKLAQEKYDGKKFSDLDEKDKSELLKNSGVFARASAANLAAAGKSAFEANKKLQENAQYADNDFVASAIESDTVSKQSMTDSMKKYDKDFISGIEENGKMYFADGKGGFSRMDSDGNLHSLSKEKIELAKKEGRIKKYEKRENDRYEDSEGNLLAPNHVQDAKRAGLTQSYGDLEIAKNRARIAGETAGMMASAGEDQNARVDAARSTQFGAAQASIDDELEGNVEAVDYIEEGGEIYYGRRDGTFRTIGGHQLGATAVESAKNAGRVRRYTGMKGSQVFRDATGNPLDTNILRGARAIGATQSLASLGQTKAAEERATKRGALVGGYLGVNSEEVANAAGLGAENSAISKINQTLGDADAITVNRNAGRNTATTRTAAAQSSEVRLEQTMSGNAGAESIQNEVNAQLAAAGNIFSGPSAEQRVGRTEDQIQKAVTRGSTILENQFQDTIEVNHVGEAKITPQVAKARAESKYIAQSTKNYQDQYGGYSRNQIETEYKNAVSNYNGSLDDRARLSASITAAMNNGLEKQALDYATRNNIPLDDYTLKIYTDSGSSLFSSYAKEQGKKAQANRVQLSTFLQDNNNGFGKMVREKGQAFVSSLNDDSLAIINKNNGVIPAEFIISELSKNPNGKIQTQLMTNLRNNIRNNNNNSFSATLTQLNGMSDAVSVDVFKLLPKAEQDKLKTEFNDPNNSTIATKVNSKLRTEIQNHVI